MPENVGEKTWVAYILERDPHRVDSQRTKISVTSLERARALVQAEWCEWGGSPGVASPLCCRLSPRAILARFVVESLSTRV